MSLVGSGSPAGKAASFRASPGHNIVMTMTIELVGVGLMAAIADSSSPAVGRIMVGLMAAFFLLWFLANSSYFNSIVGKASKYETA